MKNKRHKYGIKLYILTEPEGLVLNAAIYAGQLDSLGGKGHTQKVVLHLMREFLNNGHSIYMDSFYNSFGLAKHLLNLRTHCTGTLRSNRKDSPPDIILAKLKKGETKAAYKNGVVIGKWKDKRDVIYISTEFENEMVDSSNRRGQIKEKPLPIVQYNKYMSGIDRMDQMMAYYPCSRKTLRWYKKIAIHIFQIMLHNSHQLYNKFSGKRLSFYDFRLAVLEKLLPEQGPKLNRSSRPQVAEHFPRKVDQKNEHGKSKRKRCRVCSSKNIRKDTLYYCNVCPGEPGLCLEPCFKKYHATK